MTTPAAIPNVGTLIRRLLDGGYEGAARTAVQAIAAGNSSIATRLRQLDEEAQRLAAEGKRFDADNPVLAAVMADFDDLVARNAQAINQAAAALQDAGIQAAGTLTPALAFVGESSSVLAGVTWNQPDPETIRRVIDYASRDAFAAMINKYQKDVVKTVRETAIRQIIFGRGPVAVARDIRRLVQGFPMSEAQNLMRTLHLSSYRGATAVHQTENADIIEKVIRYAVLDKRTCMSCVALHGNELKVGDVVLDHHRGRCTSVTIVKGSSRQIVPGEKWFVSRDEAQQKSQMGKEAWNLWKQGKIALSDFTEPYHDDLFGDMQREASLKSILRRKAA